MGVLHYSPLSLCIQISCSYILKESQQQIFMRESSNYGQTSPNINYYFSSFGFGEAQCDFVCSLVSLFHQKWLASYSLVLFLFLPVILIVGLIIAETCRKLKVYMLCKTPSNGFSMRIYKILTINVKTSKFSVQLLTCPKF